MFKTIRVLSSFGKESSVEKVYDLLRKQLDSIGQIPTQVPPASTDNLDARKIPFVIKLEPFRLDKKKRYVINSASFDVGEMAERISEAFQLSNDSSIIISSYLRRTIETLTDNEWNCFVDGRELPDLFLLALDHMLEYEHGNADISGSLSSILNLYESVKEESATLYGVARKWEYKDTEYGLPLSVSEIRSVFPFPSMNPLVRNHLPAEVKSQLEGKGKPIWILKNEATNVLYFASVRDFQEYAKKDSFLSVVLQDGNNAVIMFPPEQSEILTQPLLKWLIEHKKLKIVILPALLSDFLLSAAGEVNQVESDLRIWLETAKSQKTDVLLSRKTEIYVEALNQILNEHSLVSEAFFKKQLPDTEILGKGGLDKDIAVLGISIAFDNLTSADKGLLAELRDLFKGGKEGKGVGVLNPLIGRTGHITLADTILPRSNRREGIKDSEPVSRITSYWEERDLDALRELAMIVDLNVFLKLHGNENESRFLESVWRTTRNQFVDEDLNSVISEFESYLIPILDKAVNLETQVRTELGSSGIDFGNDEKLVSAKDGLARLLEKGKECRKSIGSSSALVESIFYSYMSSLYDNIKGRVTKIDGSCNKATSELVKLKNFIETFSKNIYEFPKAIEFVGLTESKMEQIISYEKKMQGRDSLDELTKSVISAGEYFDSVNQKLSAIEKHLIKLSETFESTAKGEKNNGN